MALKMKDVRGLAWWLFWRITLSTTVLGWAAGWVVGFIAGFIMALLGYDIDVIVKVTPYMGFAAGLIVSFLCLNFFLARAIDRSFGGKNLILSGSDQTASGGM